MSKTLKKLGLLLFVPVILTGCFSVSSFSWEKYKNDNEPISAKSRKYRTLSISFDTNKFYSLMDKCLNALSSNTSIITFSANLSNLFSMKNNLDAKVYKALVEYYEKGDESSRNTYSKLYSAYIDFYTWYYSFLVALNGSTSDLKSVIFGDMTKEEIQDYIDNFKTDEKASELSKKLSDIENDGAELQSSYYRGKMKTDDYKDQMLDLYLQYIPTANELASYYGYEDYLDYVYAEQYHRDYKKDDFETIREYTFKYFNDIRDNYVNPYDRKTLSNEKQNFVVSLDKYNLCNNYSYPAEVFDAYAKEVGGTYLEAYTHLWNDGYYCFSNNTNSLGTAFVTSNIYTIDDSIVFFSSQYQSIRSVVHEFGHYFANYSGSGNQPSYDIKETHSQGDEMLFLSYLNNYYNGQDYEDAAKSYINDALFTEINYLYQFSLITEVENFCFANYKKGKEYLVNEIDKIVSKYGDKLNPTYWYYPAVCCSGYYISYATSLLASMQLYCQGKNDFIVAKENYLNFMSCTESLPSLEVWEKGQLTSPFEEETFIYLANNLLTEN